MKNEKKRSQYHCHLMSTKVQGELKKLSNKTGLAQWLIAEKILEGALTRPKFDAKKWLKEIQS